MTLRNILPRTSAAFPHITEWDLEFDWITGARDLAALLTEAQNGAREDHDQALRLSEAIRDDIGEQAALANDVRTAATIDCLRFITSISPAKRTLSLGRLGDAYNWVLGGISRTHDHQKRSNQAEYALPPYDGAPNDLNVAALRYVVDWVSSAYMVARKFGGMDDHCATFFDYSQRVVLTALASGDIEESVHASIVMANWATARGHAGAEGMVRALFELSQRDDVPGDLKTRIEVLFLTTAARWTDRPPIDWARHLLDIRRPHLVEHEILQALAVLPHDLDSWRASRDEILVEARELAATYRGKHVRAVALVSLESRVAIILPLIHLLCRVGSTEDIMDLLWAWYGEPNWERADANILFICANHSEGVGFVWPDGRWFAPHEDLAASLDELLVQASAALSEYFRGPAGDRDHEFDERRVGVPVFEEGPKLVAAMDRHYQLSGLVEQLPTDFVPRSLIVLPAHRDPFQSLFTDATGRFAPLEATLAKASHDRPIKVVSVWPGETQLTEPEVEALRAIAKNAGWGIKVREGHLNAAAFKDFYEDSDADVLWVIGHGEQSPFDVNATGIHMADEQLLSMPELSSFAVPNRGRRLLVLNICSSGSAQTRDGMARIGLAQELCSPDQQVVAHLWPIDYYAALAFACTFASKLPTEPAAAAFSSAVKIMRNQGDLLETIAGIQGGLAAHDRLSPDWVAAQLENVLCWGCPILFS